MGNGIWANWEDDLYAVKRRLSAEIDGMTPEEEIAYLRAKTDPIIKQFNIKISTLKPVKPHKVERYAE